MQTGWSQGNVAPRPATAILKAVKVPVDALTWLARPWLQPPLCTAISSMSEDLSNDSQQEHRMKTLALYVLAASLLSLAGCNTVKGVGQDLQKAGSTIEGAAKQ
jgi:predicted small secreted protein